MMLPRASPLPSFSMSSCAGGWREGIVRPETTTSNDDDDIDNGRGIVIDDEDDEYIDDDGRGIVMLPVVPLRPYPAREDEEATSSPGPRSIARDGPPSTWTVRRRRRRRLRWGEDDARSRREVDRGGGGPAHSLAAVPSPRRQRTPLLFALPIAS